ncbi:hypothetical protein [Clostridium sp. D43t1_170807_H7]|uniref:hypothetical protein n=1 Tax=Clostridium sp. D43t1_170807_H7 TaxID=2787140 RepID=UPI00189ACF48|nr:hypothetical protein [Clostridium sp. D43t1_170807_H7]
MRKFLSFIIIIISITSIISCAGNYESNNNYIKGKDAQYMYMGMNSQQYITASNEGYYFINGLYLYYCDFNGMEPIVLCNKLNCLHDKEIDSSKKYNCNGFLITGVTPKLLTIYDGYIYCDIEADFLKDSFNPELIRISLDGDKRETVCKLESDIYSMALHRGKLYYSVSKLSLESDDAEKGIYQYTLKEYDILNSGSEIKELFTGKLVDGSISNIIPIGENLIFSESGFDQESGKIIVYDSLYNIKNNKRYKIAEDISADTIGSFGISNKNLVILPRKLDGNNYITDNKLYEYNLETKESKVLFNKEFEGTFYYSDDNYIYVDNILSIEDGNQNRIITIYDKKGNKVDSIDTPYSGIYNSFISGDEKYMFLRGRSEEKAYIRYADKSKIGTGNLQWQTLFELESKYLDTTVSK